MKRTYILATLLLCATIMAYGAKIYTFDINDEINSRMWIYTQRAMEEATQENADLVVIHMNTYGGEVTFADSIRSTILNSEIPVVVYIDNNAASAGALISIACDRIYMRPGANIGAATVVNGINGTTMPDKYQSYMRATMRATAEAHGKDSTERWKRDPMIAEAMVDDRIAITGVIDSGRTLTFTAEEAVRHRYCEAIVNNMEELLVKEGYQPGQCTISEYHPSGYDTLMGWLTHTALRSVLIMIIIGGIYFELQTPGIGFPLLASACAAILYFAPLYIGGFAEYWEIGLFILGVILLVLEFFVIPGFGIAGISGILLMIIGLGFAMIENVGFDFSNVRLPNLNSALTSLFLGLILGFGTAIWIAHKIGSQGMWARLALKKEQTTEEGYVGVTQNTILIDKEGKTTTDLRPSGKVTIDGKVYDAISHRGYIEKGRNIRVRKCSSGRIYVEEQ